MTSALHAMPNTREDAILLVEDDEINQMVTIALLRQLGYVNLATAPNGEQALRVCAARTFALILMDCQMPVMDGFEATRALRARGVRTPIIAYTANDSPRVRSRCLEAGMDDFLPKPAELPSLRRTVERWLPASP